MAADARPDPYDLDPDRGPLLRSTVLAWQASMALLLLAALFALGWLWITVRAQQHLSSGAGFSFSGDVSSHPSLVDRLDAVSSTLTLLWYACVTAALGLGLRIAGDAVGSGLRARQVDSPDPTIGPDTP